MNFINLSRCFEEYGIVFPPLMDLNVLPWLVLYTQNFKIKDVILRNAY